jgi:monoamine oxidase
MLALASRLGLRSFPQYASGRLVFEDGEGAIRRDLDFATMGGALRIEGGLTRVTDALAEQLGPSLRLDHPVQRVTEDASCVTLSGDNFEIRAARVVFALPPRLTARFGVTVPDVPTWMAGQAKLIATYAKPFWRDSGLNGDAISHRGPLAEIHDASPAEARTGALFGFAHPGATRNPDFRDTAVAQLARLFGPMAATPREVFVKDWSNDVATATQADRMPPAGHPTYSAIPSTARLIFAGSETSPVDGGFLEGALAAAEAAHANLGKHPD